jgi:outer membrane lipoprotein carrier protein
MKVSLIKVNLNRDYKRSSMNKVIFFRLIFLTFFLFNSASYAADQPVKQLQAFLKASKSLTADFKQVLINEAGDPYQTSFGVFYLQRPGKFRWDYLKPFQQQIVSTSGKVWFYDTDLEQVTIKKLDESCRLNTRITIKRRDITGR